VRGTEDDRDRQERRFHQLYQVNYRPILAYAVRRVVPADDAGDVFAEVFTTAWRRLADIPSPPSDRLWLYGVARRVIAGRRRSAGRPHHRRILAGQQRRPLTRRRVVLTGAVAAVVAGAVAAAVIVPSSATGRPGTRPAGGFELDAATVLHRAAQAALATPPMPSGKFEYIQTKTVVTGPGSRPPSAYRMEYWWAADGIDLARQMSPCPRFDRWSPRGTVSRRRA
jgi:DNA-directed RNA polymerase specialized sigma24 family protein